MGLKEIIKSMNFLIENIVKDLKKAERGFKAASQRVRTGTIKLANIAKTYRKESVAEEKKMKKKSPLKAKKSKIVKKKSR
jgi:hypothetical protein